VTALLPGAEPWSFTPEPVGALCLHGFTGNPSSMRGVAHAFARAGFAVELPLLPGHGTHLADMLDTTWAEWAGEAEAAFERLAARCGRVVVSGLSMGATLALWLATRHPEIAGLVCVNPATRPQPPEVLDMVRGMVDEGERIIPGIGSDVADPDVTDAGYEGTPLVPLLSLMDALADLVPRYGTITCPLLLVTSRHDHVIDPASSDFLAAVFGGPVERLTLERSFHVATLDFDKELICERAVAFARKVTA
jgi:carboxylesterase